MAGFAKELLPSLNEARKQMIRTRVVAKSADEALEGIKNYIHFRGLLDGFRKKIEDFNTECLECTHKENEKKLLWEKPLKEINDILNNIIISPNTKLKKQIIDALVSQRTNPQQQPDEYALVGELCLKEAQQSSFGLELEQRVQTQLAAVLAAVLAASEAAAVLAASEAAAAVASRREGLSAFGLIVLEINQLGVGDDTPQPPGTILRTLGAPRKCTSASS